MTVKKEGGEKYW